MLSAAATNIGIVPKILKSRAFSRKSNSANATFWNQAQFQSGGKKTRCRYIAVPFLLLILFASACASARKPVPPGVIPDAKPITTEEEQYGHTVLAELSEQYELDYNDPRLDKAIEIVDRLAKSANANQDPWHVYLFKAPEVKNAAATRGNHVFIWSGIFDAAKNDDELAAILSHEIAHVLSGHTEPDPNEMVKEILIQVGALAAQIAVTYSTNNPQLGHDLGQIAASLTTELGQGFLTNPYSQELELEADRVGLLIMAEAKYDPRQALEFWKRAQNDPTFDSGFAFFSTHPLAEDRLAQLEKVMPEAMARYEGKGGKSGIPMKRLDLYYGKNEDLPILTLPSDTSNTSALEPGLSHWRVKNESAVLYSRQQTSSKTLGQFKQGTILVVIKERGEWLEIMEPDHGYLKRADLEPQQ